MSRDVVVSAKCGCGAELGYMLPDHPVHRENIAHAFRAEIEKHEIGCKKEIRLSGTHAQ